MKLSVLIATFNRRDLLARTLPKVLEQDFSSSDYEVIVVNDGSTDGTDDLLNTFRPKCNLTVLQKQNEGQGIALNQGIAAAQGELVLFLDDDIVCPVDLVSQHVSAHKTAGRDVVISGPVYISPESAVGVASEWLRQAESLYKQSYFTATDRYWPADCKLDANSSVDRELLIASGLFQPEFSRARFDLELGLRLHRKGVRFVLHRSAHAEQIYTKLPHTLARVDAGLYAAKELSICRTYPEYRADSTFARLNEGSLLKRTVRKLLVRAPFALQPMMTSAAGALGKFPSGGILNRLGVRLLQASYTTNLLRTASRSISWDSFHKEFGAQLPVLLYHHIGPLRPGTFPTLTVSPAKFKSQIEWLARNGYQAITANEWLLWANEGTELPTKPILLTFDDGYKDLAEFAFPILQQNGFRATVFIVSSQIGGSNVWDQANGSGAHALLTAEEIRHWSDNDIEFGSHSVNHPDLTSLNATELQSENEISGRNLSALLGHRISSFAYPYGAFNAGVRESIRQHYKVAFTTDVGLNHLGSDLFALKRTMVQSRDSLLDLWVRLHFGWNPIEGARRRVAQMRGRVPKELSRAAAR